MVYFDREPSSRWPVGPRPLGAYGGTGLSQPVGEMALLHLAKPRHARPLILGWSDRQGQLVEGGRHPQGRCFVNAELVVAATDVLDERVPGDDDSG